MTEERVFQDVGLLSDHGSDIAVIITHPWGILGGNKHNPVVVAASRYFQSSFRWSTLRFDFVGSQIGFGTAQVKQLEDMAKALLEQTAANRILLVGYSYGSLIAASLVAMPEIIGMVAIAPPFGVAHWLLCFQSDYHLKNGKERPELPRLFVIGDADNFTEPSKFHQMVAKHYEGAQSIVMKDVDHFFRRSVRQLMDIIGKWVVETIPQSQKGRVELG